MNGMKKNGGKEVKKMSKKKIIGDFLMIELENDSRFDGLSLEEAIDKIGVLRKNNESHLSDAAYALFIAYKNGLSVYKKYVNSFVDVLKANVEELKKKCLRYMTLIEEFDNVRNVVEEAYRDR